MISNYIIIITLYLSIRVGKIFSWYMYFALRFRPNFPVNIYL